MYSKLYILNSIFEPSLLPEVKDKLVNFSPSSFSLSKSIIEENIIKATEFFLTEDECSLYAAESFSISDLFSFISKIADEMMLFSGKELHVKSNQMLRWKRYTERNGEDLFCCAYLAKVKFAVSVPFLEWDYSLTTDDKLLHSCLLKGFSENHFHLNGSAPIFYLNWNCLNNCGTPAMIFSRERKKIFCRHYPSRGDYEKFKSACVLSSLTRKYLFLTLQSTLSEAMILQNDFRTILSSFDDSFRQIRPFCNQNLLVKWNVENQFARPKTYDYCETLVTTPSVSSVETGERALLYYSFLHFNNWKPFDQVVFYFYLVLKRFVASYFCQSNNRLGFKNFTHFEKMSDFFLSDSSKKKIPYFAMKYLNQNDGLLSAELRIAPKEDFPKMLTCLKNNIKYIAAFQNDIKERTSIKKEIKYFFTYHFIKEEDKMTKFSSKIFCPCRNYELRKTIQKETNNIISLVSSAKRQYFRIGGIDSANSEIGCRPEVFAVSYRRIRNYAFYDGREGKTVLLNLGFTYHVAEDFVGIVDGLRAIHEAIIFLNLKKGDRLGHCVALGTKSSDYYTIKRRELIFRKQNLLDDHVWLYSILSNNHYSDLNFLEKIKNESLQFLLEVYGPSHTIESYFNAMLLRGDDPELYRDSSSQEPKTISQYRRNTQLSRHREAVSDADARMLFCLYHFSVRVREEGNKCVDYVINDEYVRAVSEAQNCLKSIIIQNGISIETNPTSNYLIGPFFEYKDIPLFSFNSHGLSFSDNSKEIPICINTDDQGIFRTSLSAEYSIILELLTSGGDPLDRIPNVNSEQAYNYVDYLRQLSNDVSFLK